MWQIEVKAPTRVDLLGGTLDLWPLHYLLENRATINLGVSIHARIRLSKSNSELFKIRSIDQGIEVSGTYSEVLERHELSIASNMLKYFWDKTLPPLECELYAESPQGAGLGGSSSLAMCLAYALVVAKKQLLDQEIPDENRIVNTVQNIETNLLGMPAGSQDHWGALRGKINAISYPFSGQVCETYDPELFRGCDETLILCYCGKSRFSGLNNWEIYKRFIDQDKKVVGIFTEIGALSLEAVSAVKTGNWDRVLHLSEKEWQLRKTISHGIETEETMLLDQESLRAGAYFSRVCGAGGGGVMAVFAPKKRRESVREALVKAGGKILDSRITNYGLLAYFNGEIVSRPS